ncbi:SWIM zinc finger family protein [Paenibacillus sp. HWE-109]|uniref:SWIM zinc finger family protein n=1 Tax=Paenibacillus sp. HWE-109 TaxID=1306526 RepID=UPI001EDE256C|nr:SWIM zinc finger family protein [Paenibacillus sp. HWE-109]UKS28815.1 SWIM zinc finger family protein [Paenibacillus sp. HWE-109]
MSSTPLLNDSQWLKLIEYVAATYNEVTLSRGFTHFKQEQVKQLTISEGRTVQARVEEADTYQVSLNLDKLSLSQCTCPVQHACKHLAAVMMELADRQGYLPSQIMNAKLYLKRAAASSDLDSAMQQLPNMDVTGWHRWLNQYTSSIKPSLDQSTYAESLRKSLASITRASVPFTDREYPYWELHQSLFILRKIKELQLQAGPIHYSSSTIYRIAEDLQIWLKNQGDAVGSLESSALLQQTSAYCREQMAEDAGQKYHDFGIYMTFWQYWILPGPEAASLLPAEIAELDKWLDEHPTPSLAAAKAFLLLRMAKGDMAWKALEESPGFKAAPASLFITFLTLLIETQNWEILVDWLHKSSSFFNTRRTRELEIYANMWKTAIAHVPESEEQMWRIFEDFLPQSLRVIEQMLYEQEKWKPWLEMQMLFGHDPFHHRVSVLQPIEKANPSLLLPYFHQAVDHYVSLKNRRDYKAATRLLKRLEKVYKKMKQPERWDSYFSGFVERHSRLRALQEELRKGKLLE